MFNDVVMSSSSSLSLFAFFLFVVVNWRSLS